ncbi:MAG: GGDEF domain-containing protein, partial [Undibacterium sp.]|nr:GGDEF domain-containing protein [Undibacterium sp.]
PPGEYRLHLRGSNRNGVWTDQDLILPILVLPAWFQTWWAYFSYAFLFFAFTFGVIRWRLWRLKNANKLLELLVLDRTRELELSKKMLEEQSFTDHLTGLRNRRYLKLCIGEDIALVNRMYQELDVTKINRGSLSIDIIFMMVDIDHFKSVNDEYGHAAGDLVLIQTTEILKKAVRDTDTIIRWGGEEFLIIARHANYQEAEVLAERIRAQMAAHDFVLADGSIVHRTCSLGSSTYPFIPSSMEAFTWEQVVDIADQCLYAAKHGGRNAWIALFAEEAMRMNDEVTNAVFDVERQINLKNVIVKTSLPPEVRLDWSHGRGK